MTNALVPEFAVTDYRRSRNFYCAVLGFSCAYERPEEGFGYLKLGSAELMIDQIGLGRTFGGTSLPDTYPFGKGLNVQIRVPSLRPLLESLKRNRIALYLPLEEKWYLVGPIEKGHQQFVVADPDGYLLRFHEDLGSRPAR
ncbi:VOC family protein [Aurantimonas aggregata]|uniref:Bleomycin resistance protein n=1 Tax=Aurantimonas aggregata TaxID=2047720 RepID=A0A6L9MJ20_9HYPH|nr:VOC family protein [Aurantimonas aggregata]NDV87829.1 VOC family protein [Aurantimonas aggregata]